jgi:hypothetical protein
MWPTRMFPFLAAMLVALSSAPVFSDTQTGSDATWKCPQADGSVIYTNKEKTGCEVMVLKPLSVVPDLVNMPTAPRTTTTSESHYEVPSYQERIAGAGGYQVPDWARDWYASNTSAGSAQAEVCSLYVEWMHLVQKTRGGMFFGADPSYGGDITGRTQRMPSHSFYDNARYIALSRLFGTGFVPIGCF